MKIPSPQEQARIIDEVFDSGRIMLVCNQHMYTPGGKSDPHPGCSNCVQAMFIHQLAHSSPEFRQAKLDALEAIVHHLVEDEARGVPLPKFYAHPKIDYEKS